MALRVPYITPDTDTLTAALAYARLGWYVIPVTADTKAPTVVGKGWQNQSSTDPEQIVAWFAGTDHALGIHVGRSNAIVFDVDEPDMIPDALQQAIKEFSPPYQSTRDDQEGRGHYVFEITDGRFLGNGRGQLLHPEHGKKWGEVRGTNGIIVVQPSRHVKPNGRYVWILDEDMEVPALPSYLSALLPDGTPSSEAVNDSAVQTFLDDHKHGASPALAKPIYKRFAEDMATGSRHEALVAATAWACRDIHAGLINAQEVHDRLRTMFLEAMGDERQGGRVPTSEFKGVFAWAVGQALAMPASQRKEAVVSRLEAEEDDPFGASQMSKSSLPAKAAKGQVVVEGKIRDSADYFPRDWVTNTPQPAYNMLVDDVLIEGPLAVARDHRFWAYEDGVWHEDRLVVQRRVDAALRDRYRPNHWGIVEQKLNHRPEVYALAGDPTPDYINFANGMLEWRTGVLHDHDPGFLSTIQLPYDWDENATADAFDAWLHSILSPDFVRLAWEMIGYLMMSGNPLQVAFLMLGKGGNGKGTLMRVIKRLLGAGNFSSISLDDITGNRFAAANLYGKVANLAGDIDATFQESTAKFKMLTGEDEFTAENKGQDSFQFVNWAVPVFSANKAPGSADTSEGYLRRWVVLEFERQFSAKERKPGLANDLVKEIPGIAARGVLALRELMDRGYFFDGGDVQAGKARFVENLDQVRQFIDQCCEMEPEGSEPQPVLYSSYKSWADINGAGRLSAKEFYGRLENAGHAFVKVNGVRKHRGIRVVNHRMLAPGENNPVLLDPLERP